MNSAGPAPVDQSAYTEDYYLSGVEGYELFRATGGQTLSPRLARAMELAAVRPGDRLLDVGCGRGEVVLQASLQGATAIGIDYAEVGVRIAGEAVRRAERRAEDQGPRAGRSAVARMDACRLALWAGSFDVAVMLDFVEHVHQPELERSFAELARSLRPGGRLVVHTSPNRVLEQVVYPRYVVRVHRVLRAVGRTLGKANWFFNDIVLPLEPTPDHDEFERALHVNPQSAGSLRKALERAGFRVARTDFWEPPSAHFFPREQRGRNASLALLDAVRFLRPLSRWPPLDRLFSNHVWIVAVR
jgi:cyclopropane fatty-acyl-phospholipid synthase-like methyltransferase